MLRELAAELIGTFALVSAVCGAALFSAPSAGLIAVAFAVGLSVLAMAYAVGHISGGHFNPAVTCGLIAAGHFKAEKAIGYIVARCCRTRGIDGRIADRNGDEVNHGRQFSVAALRSPVYGCSG